MAEKTIRGNKCPHCASFLKEGTETCPVCGKSLTADPAPTGSIPLQEGIDRAENPANVDRPAAMVICGKCGTENRPDFRFCKICKYPLRETGTAGFPPPSPERPPSAGGGVQLELEWKRVPPGYKTIPRLDLQAFPPYFTGVAEWQGYGFFVYRDESGENLLVRRTDPASGPTLLRQCRGGLCLKSGGRFYLGALSFQVLGDVVEKPDTRTVMRSEKTVLRGPGESDGFPGSPGLPRIKAVDPRLSAGEPEIRERILLGRDWLCEHLGCDPEELRRNGISQEHAFLSPLAGGFWFLEPLADKPVFDIIGPEPVLINGGEPLRFLEPAGPVEFTIDPKPGRM